MKNFLSLGCKIWLKLHLFYCGGENEVLASFVIIEGRIYYRMIFHYLRVIPFQ